MGCLMIPLRLITLLIVGVVQFEISSASSGISTARPGWLSHVDDATLKKYLEVARERHTQAVQTALQNYNTDDTIDSLNLSTEDLQKEQDIVNTRRFDKFRIEAHGKLPDFQDQLGDQPVFVTSRDTPLFSREECKDVISMAEEYYGDGPWPKLPSGQYFIQGCWIKDVPPVRKWFVEKCKARLFPLLKQQFPDFVDSIDDLVVDQAYLFKYVPQPGLRTEIHTDAGCLSFTFSLNPKEEYEGGGTWVEGLVPDGEDADDCSGSLIEMDTGQCTVRPGGIRHCGNPLTQGTRYIIGGFCMSKSRVESVRQLMNNDCGANESTETTRETLECAIALNPHYDGPYPALASCYEKEGDTAKAQKVLEECLLTANPKSSTAAYYLGTMYYRQGKYGEACECMKTCLEVDSSDGDAMGTLAQVYSHLGQVEAERDMYQRIIIAPGVSNRVLANAYCNLGTMEKEGSEMEMEYYKKALEFVPSSIPALQSLGSAYASQKDWDNAIHSFRQVVDSSQGSEYEQVESLNLLYRAATQKVREEGLDGASREQVMERLGNMMGAGNMDRLVSMQTK